MTDDAIQAELQACREALDVIEARWQEAAAAFDGYRHRTDSEREAELEARRQQLEAEHQAELDNHRQRIENEREAELKAHRQRLEDEYQAAFDDYRQRVETEREADLEAHCKRLEAEHQADLNQVRQRAERELERVRQHERETVLRDWLEVIDNLERALMHRDRSALARLWEGLVAVYRQAQGLLKRYEVNRIPTRGVYFDPTYHEAVGRTHGAPDGMIVEEVKPGYVIGDTVLRPAQVVVAVQEIPRRAPYGI